MVVELVSKLLVLVFGDFARKRGGNLLVRCSRMWEDVDPAAVLVDQHDCTAKQHPPSVV